MPVEEHAAGGRPVEPEEEPRERRLARAGFADQPERLAAADLERDAVHRPNHVTVACGSDPEMPVQVFRGDERLGRSRRDQPGPLLGQVTRGPDGRRSARGAAASRCGSRSSAYGQRGWKEQPDGSSCGRGGWPPIAAIGASTSSSSRQIAPSSASLYGMHRAGEQPRRPALRSTIRPAYMTWIVSQIVAASPRSCVIRITPSSRSSTSRPSRSTMRACVVTSSAVVGSSAIRTSGFGGDRHRDHHALTHSAGELVRIAVEAARRRGDADVAEQLDRPRARHRLGDVLVERGSPRRSAGRSERTGLSDDIGSW